MRVPHEGHFLINCFIACLPYFYDFITCLTNMRNKFSIFLIMVSSLHLNTHFSNLFWIFTFSDFTKTNFFFQNKLNKNYQFITRIIKSCFYVLRIGFLICSY